MGLKRRVAVCYKKNYVERNRVIAPIMAGLEILSPYQDK
jgi:hypothetical protein